MSGMSYRAVVITCSDRAAADIYEDRSGVVLRDGLANLGFEVDAPVVLPDDAPLIAQAIADAVDGGARVVDDPVRQRQHQEDYASSQARMSPVSVKRSCQLKASRRICGVCCAPLARARSK